MWWTVKFRAALEKIRRLVHGARWQSYSTHPDTHLPTHTFTATHTARDREAERNTDREKNRHTERQSGGQPDMETNVSKASTQSTHTQYKNTQTSSARDRQRANHSQPLTATQRHTKTQDRRIRRAMTQWYWVLSTERYRKRGHATFYFQLVKVNVVSGTGTAIGPYV